MDKQDFYGISAVSAVDAFCIAALNGKVPVMKRLIADGVDINAKAAFNGASALQTAASIGMVRSVECLLEAGADLEPIDRNDLTPLLNACALGGKKGDQVALLLINAGANARYVRASDQMTALKFAAQGSSPEVIQALIDHGAEVDGPAGTDQTALMLAARANHVPALKVLIENGADPTLPCKIPWAQGRTAEGLAELEKRRAALAYLRSVRPSST